ncbi:MAG: cupredoxin domain-containing protein [Thermoanaerobaculia bacterium]
MSRFLVAALAALLLLQAPAAGSWWKRRRPIPTPTATPTPAAAERADEAAAGDPGARATPGPVDPRTPDPASRRDDAPIEGGPLPAAPPATPFLVPLPTPSPTPLPTATPRPTPTPIPTGTLRVKVLVTGSDGRTLPAPDAVVWIPGSRGRRPTPPPKMASRDKRFEPRVLAVPKGGAVTFPNFDKIFHNVFSLSEPGRFDLGLYRNGAARTTRFSEPGVVRVYCNIHPQMAAYVVVLDGELHAQSGADGVAAIAAVPAGRHAVKVWDERGGEWSGTASVTAGRTTDVSVTLDATKWKAIPHKNKHGKDYPPPDDDENRY